MLLKLVAVGVHFANLGLPQSDIDSSRSAQRRRSQMNEQSLSDRPLQNPGTEVHFTLRHLPESPTEFHSAVFFFKEMCCAVTTTASALSRFCHSPRPSVELGKLYQNAVQSYSYLPTYQMLQDWITGLFGNTYFPGFSHDSHALPLALIHIHSEPCSLSLLPLRSQPLISQVVATR